jgi:hypothetical protein
MLVGETSGERSEQSANEHPGRSGKVYKVRLLAALTLSE